MTVATTKDWKAVSAAKQAQRDATIPAAWRIKVDPSVKDVMDVPKTCGVLTPKEIEITETPATELIEQMLAKKLTSEEVTVAFCKRAAIAQQLTNCLTEIFFEEGIERAKKIDAEYAATGKPAGPLHGLPFSLKDCFNVKGKDSTIGFIAYCNQPSETESVITRTLYNMGAVFYCKTNIPTSMMIAESYNNVFGYCTNPWNRLTSSGGSSGGEGALVAMKGSPLGLGTDIGGSIRIPSALCGIYGLKPSFGRFPTYGGKSSLPGQEAVRATNGPMSTTIDACELFAKAVMDTEPWNDDPQILPIPWRKVELPEKLCFGMIVDDTLCKPTPPVLRGLAETKAALEAAGHRVVEWVPYDVERNKNLLFRLFEGDGGAKIASVIEEGGEPWPQGLQPFQKAWESSKDKARTVADLWTAQAERTAYCKEALDYWIATKEISGTGRPFDGVISPVSPHAAPKHYEFHHLMYTGVWNLTDQSSFVFPVTRATKSDVKDANNTPNPFRNETEERTWNDYNADEIEGAPVALQVVTRRLEEEKAVALGRVIAAALEKSRK